MLNFLKTRIKIYYLLDIRHVKKKAIKMILHFFCSESSGCWSGHTISSANNYQLKTDQKSERSEMNRPIVGANFGLKYFQFLFFKLWILIFFTRFSNFRPNIFNTLVLKEESISLFHPYGYTYSSLWNFISRIQYSICRYSIL